MTIALIDLHDKISSAIDRGELAVGVFADGSTKTWNPESGNGNGITETETEYGIKYQ